ncbi:MAG: flagellar biosynthetic protein FliQ, partial [Polyangiaceae bacterium]
MTSDQALYLMMGLLENAVMIAGPVLGAALVGGVFIGVLQTATQINEMSIAYVVKAGCVLLVFLFA